MWTCKNCNTINEEENTRCVSCDIGITLPAANGGCVGSVIFLIVTIIFMLIAITILFFTILN